MGKKWNAVLFSLYCGLMLWLTLDRSGAAEGVPYWEQVRDSLNLVPFRTILKFVPLLTFSRASLVRLAVVNLFGNIVMFIPLGFFLPRVFPKLRRIWKTLLVTLLSISVIELVQLFSLVGSCDIDDLILNLTGAVIGYGIFKLTHK